MVFLFRLKCGGKNPQDPFPAQGHATFPNPGPKPGRYKEPHCPRDREKFRVCLRDKETLKTEGCPFCIRRGESKRPILWESRPAGGDGPDPGDAGGPHWDRSGISPWDVRKKGKAESIGCWWARPR